MRRAPVVMLVGIAISCAVAACVGAPATLASPLSSNADAGAKRKTDGAPPTSPDAKAGDTSSPAPLVPDAGRPDPQVRAYSAPTVLQLQDILLKEESLEITEPWFGVSKELYFRSGEALAQENFNVTCNWAEGVCRAGGKQQVLSSSEDEVVRPCTLGTAASSPLTPFQRGPMLYGQQGDLLVLSGKSKTRTVLENAEFAYVFAGTSDFSAVTGNHLKLFRYKSGSDGTKPSTTELSDFGPFAGSYHAMDNASDPTIAVYTNAAGQAAARTRSNGAWTDAPAIVAHLKNLQDARMTWMSTDSTRIVFSAKEPGSTRAQMYTATR